MLTWRTWKLKRRAIGSNDAEVQSILEAEDVVLDRTCFGQSSISTLRIRLM